MMSNPSSRQFDLTTTTREKISHDIWKNEVHQANSSEAEDGDLGLRGLNEDFHLELRKEEPTSPYTPLSTPPLFPRSATPRIETPSQQRIPSRTSTPVPPQETEMDNITAHIRSAATMLAQLNSKSLPKADAQAIRTRILAEMSVLEDRRLEMSLATEDSDTSIERTMVDKEDPSAAVFAEDWATKRERIRKGSVWGSLPGWEVCSVIVKSECEMEFIGSQFISGLKRIWEMDKIDVWLRRYPSEKPHRLVASGGNHLWILTLWSMNVLVTSNGYGLIETITGAMSIHSIKKGLTSTYVDEQGRTKTKYGTLKDHFITKFGAEKSPAYARAQLNFIKSLAGYSMATYILSLKDRHNGNILVDEEGHIVRTSPPSAPKFPSLFSAIFSKFIGITGIRHRFWVLPLEFARPWHGLRNVPLQTNPRLPRHNQH